MKTQTKEQTYFAGITNPDQLQILYRALALQFHPDRGGDLAKMQEINAQYDEAKRRLEAPAAERQYSPPPPKSGPIPLNHEAIMAANLVRVFCPGCWADVTAGEVIALGKTYENKEALKRLGFWWSPELRAWHFVRRPGTSGKGANN